MTSLTYTITATERLVTENCCKCGVMFGMAEDFRANRLRDHTAFYCPNGHSQSYVGKTNEQRLTEQLEAARRIAANERDRRVSAERSASAHKGVATRVKRRAAHGVCPCCNRTFADVARHMAGQHPAFVAEHSGGAA